MMSTFLQSNEAENLARMLEKGILEMNSNSFKVLAKYTFFCNNSFNNNYSNNNNKDFFGEGAN